MSISENSLDSEEQRLLRAWQQRSNLADRIADKRMRLLISVIGVLLLLWILYYWLRPESLPGSRQHEHVVATASSKQQDALPLAEMRKQWIKSCPGRG
jgi:hypothetical protein